MEAVPTGVQEAGDVIVVDGVELALTTDPDELMGWESSPTRLVFGKAISMLADFEEALGERTITNMVDLGIFKGGSVAYYAKRFGPERLVAIDLMAEPCTALEAMLDDEGIRSSVSTYYGVDQADAATVSTILETEFGAEPIDVVVDDASHLYGPTVASFNVLFPRLRPGGLYVIEDWAWAHWQGDSWQSTQGAFFDVHPALSNLIVEIVLTAATRPDLVEKVVVRSASVYVTRGAAPAESHFDISRAFANRGRPYRPTL